MKLPKNKSKGRSDMGWRRHEPERSEWFMAGHADPYPRIFASSMGASIVVLEVPPLLPQLRVNIYIKPMS